MRGESPGTGIAGLINLDIGGYRPGDIEVVAAFDVERRKVGLPVGRAIFSPPNCTPKFVDEIPDGGPIVRMGPVLDGVAAHMQEHPEDRTFVPSKEAPCVVEAVLRVLGGAITW